MVWLVGAILAKAKAGKMGKDVILSTLKGETLKKRRGEEGTHDWGRCQKQSECKVRVNGDRNGNPTTE